jgi:hypothetical protein
MKRIVQQDFTGNLLKLMAETFEGPPGQAGGAYLDGGAGLFQTIGLLTARAASEPPRSNAPTVVAHCAHLRYYVQVLHEFILGGEPSLAWQRSWEFQAADEAQWNALRSDLRASYEALMATLNSLASWNDDSIGDGMAILVHTAYHLGAIRQVVKAIATEGEIEPRGTSRSG